MAPVPHGSFFTFHTEQWKDLCSQEAQGEESHPAQTSHASTLAGLAATETGKAHCCLGGRDNSSPPSAGRSLGSFFYVWFYLLVLWSMEAHAGFHGVFLRHGHILQSKSLADNICPTQ